jgi:aryl-alcohol dehydrogenase-like predicted oxidoreductase
VANCNHPKAELPSNFISMKYRLLGTDTREVSCVGYGGMHISIVDRPDEATAINTIHSSLDHGVTLIDTADVYCLDHNDIGHNERLISKALEQWSGDRNSITVATKAGMVRPDGGWQYDGSPEHIKSACDASLKALDVDCLDLYQHHAPDPNVPFADSLGAFRELQDEGKIRWIGISNVSVSEIEEASAVADIKTVQNRLNPFFREAISDGVVKHCDQNGIAFLAYSPVGGGRLNKKLPDHEVVGPIAAAHETTPHAVVLAWVLAQSPSVIIIPAARSAKNAISSTMVPDIELSPAEIAAIDSAEFSRK